MDSLKRIFIILLCFICFKAEAQPKAVANVEGEETKAYLKSPPFCSESRQLNIFVRPVAIGIQLSFDIATFTIVGVEALMGTTAR